jgi:hypothetical protein
MSGGNSVIGVFDNSIKAENALTVLNAEGVTADHFSLLVSESGKKEHFKIDKSKSKTAEGVGYGAVLGGLAAGLGTAAAGVASVTVPGGVFIAGPLAVSLAAGTAGAAVGGLTGGLVGLGLPEDEVELVEKEIGDGSILVAAQELSGEEKRRAVEIFKKAGALRVH